jgi:hypothetical protein
MASCHVHTLVSIRSTKLLIAWTVGCHRYRAQSNWHLMAVVAGVTLHLEVTFVEPDCFETVIRSSSVEVTATPLFISPDRPYLKYTGSGVTKLAWYSTSLRPSSELLVRWDTEGRFYPGSCVRGTRLTATRPMPLPCLWPKKMSSDEGRMQSGHVAYIMQLPCPSEVVRSTPSVFFEILNIVAAVP